MDITLPDKFDAHIEKMAGKVDITRPDIARKLIKGLFKQILELLPIQDQDHRDNFALAFVSMDYIIWWNYQLPSRLKPNWKLSQKEEIYADIYSKIEDENLVKYLKLIVSKFLDLGTLNEAIKMEPNLRIAYYLKCITLMSNLKSDKDIASISKQERKEIFYCVKKIRDLGWLLTSICSSPGLVTIDENIGNADHIDFDYIMNYLKNAERAEKITEQLAREKENNRIYQDRIAELTREVNLEEVDKYIIQYFEPEIFEELSRRKNVLNTWRFGEFFWINYYEKAKAQLDGKIKDMELTALVVSFLKSIEVYLHEKILELGAGKTISWLGKGKTYVIGDQWSEDDSEEIKIRSGTKHYVQFIMNHPTCMMRNQDKEAATVEAKEISENIKNWAKEVRNSKLHKHNIKDFQELEKIKKDTISLFSILVRKLKLNAK